MYLRNYRYVAASDREIGRRPLGRIILGEPIVFYRLEDGTPVALEDRCAHRHFRYPWANWSATRCSATTTGCATTRAAPACGCRAKT